MHHFHHIINHFQNKRIMVIGDVVLDQYIRGSVSRISPEAPVPIVLQEGESFYTPGGASNVANNLQSLGSKVTIVGRIGKDLEAKILLKELKKRKINTEGLLVDKKLPTSLKTRIIAQHQQVLRLDREKVMDLADHPLTIAMIDFICQHIDDYDAIIISDYGKGVINSTLLANVCSIVRDKRKIITVDPKVEHFSLYHGVTAITPNRKEAENAIRNIKITHHVGRRLPINHDQLLTDDDINRAGEALLKYLKLESLLITLGEQGMRLFEKNKKPIHIDTRAQEVFDVTGAGDTVIAVFTLALTAGASKEKAAELANYAAGVVVQKIGAVPITRQELLEAIKN